MPARSTISRSTGAESPGGSCGTGVGVGPGVALLIGSPKVVVVLRSLFPVVLPPMTPVNTNAISVSAATISTLPSEIRPIDILFWSRSSFR